MSLNGLTDESRVNRLVISTNDMRKFYAQYLRIKPIMLRIFEWINPLNVTSNGFLKGISGLFFPIFDA